ncbi:S26 family signal peptidase [Cellulomonas sp. NPDC089187]|uniref:S26 family signal peptidase n=1 Tax=Cellulomonas sp. NPDC089187 TaxID=3154970 RepID=UPI003417860C
MSRSLAVLVLVVMAFPLGWSLLTGDFYMTVTGVSMTPTYQRGDVLVVQRPDGQELRRTGEVVVISASRPDGPGPRYVHRVVEPLSDGSAWLQGDGNAARDPLPVSPDSVVGTPRMVLTGIAARILLFTESLWGRIALGAIALALLFAPRATARARH